MKRCKCAVLAAFVLAALWPGLAHACACGCGIFDVGTGTMMPTDAGGTVWFEYDFMNQTNDWHNSSRTALANNDDKILRTNFFQVGGQYMFNRSWGIMGDLPFTDRFFKTTDDDTGDLVDHRHHALGDVHLEGVYSGFSDDMSTGVTFGFKLPTGDYTYQGLDRDSSIGSGSTDWLLGAYHMGAIDEKGVFDWFTNGQWDHPFLTQGSYRPGDEIDASVGAYYNGFDFGGAGKIAPLLQLLGSWRWRDSGANADPSDSGYKRLLVSPGVEYDINDVKLYGDVEVPVYQYVNGYQLTAPVLVKFIVGYSF